jgi:hypothetical protein
MKALQNEIHCISVLAGRGEQIRNAKALREWKNRKVLHS